MNIPYALQIAALKLASREGGLQAKVAPNSVYERMVASRLLIGEAIEQKRGQTVVYEIYRPTLRGIRMLTSYQRQQARNQKKAA